MAKLRNIILEDLQTRDVDELFNLAEDLFIDPDNGSLDADWQETKNDLDKDDIVDMIFAKFKKTKITVLDYTDIQKTNK